MRVYIFLLWVFILCSACSNGSSQNEEEVKSQNRISSFGKNGIVFLSFFGFSQSSTDYGHSWVMDAKLIENEDILIYACVEVNPGFYNSYIPALIKYKNNGTRDETFGTNGVVYNITAQGDVCNPLDNNLSLLQDGSLLLTWKNELLITTSTGSLISKMDLSFNPQFSTILTDQSVIIAGSSKMIKLNSNGELDTNFGGGSEVEIGCKPSAGNIRSIIDEGSHFYVLGTYCLAKYNWDGSVDTSYGDQGFINSFDFSAISETAYSGLLTESGNLLVGGLNLIRLLNDGSLDSTYGINGFVKLNGFGAQIAKGQNGIDYIYTTTKNKFVLKAVNSRGGSIESFGISGEVEYELENYTKTATAKKILIQSDGKIIVIGGQKTEFSFGDTYRYGIYISRLRQDGSLD